eukprot:m.131184 g.131184  ORF g.131184 m.131184 type:complete len:73 (+) comp22412_c0_seq3:203-421(+)
MDCPPMHSPRLTPAHGCIDCIALPASCRMSGPQMTVVGFEEQHAKAPDFVESGSASGELNRLQAAHLALQSR